MKKQLLMLLLIAMIYLSAPCMVVNGNNEETNSKNIGYTKETVNVMQQPYQCSEVLGVIPFNTCIIYQIYDDEWVHVEYEDSNIGAYIKREDISVNQPESFEYFIINKIKFKSYMPYTSITDKASKQYELQDTYAYTGIHGIRQVNHRYCVAVGTAFNTNIGDYVDLILENGEVIPVIISDIKADKDTDSRNIATKANGCVSEFIVDTDFLHKEAKKNGSISFCKNEWDSPVVSIKVYNKNIFEEEK